MDAAHRALRTEHLLKQLPEGSRLTLLEDSKAAAASLAHRLGMQDPENDAQDALAHLLEQLPAYVDRFVNDDLLTDVESFRKWSRVVLRHRLLEIKRRESREQSLSRADTSVGELLDVISFRSGSHELDWIADAESLLIERDKLISLLELILRLRDTQRDLVLGRMAGFSRIQLSEALPYTLVSQSVLVNRLKDRIEHRPTDFRKKRARLFEDPARDIPLSTQETPALRKALRTLTSPLGTRLLKAVVAQEDTETRSYLCRMAGFWDCVIATAHQVPLSTHRSDITIARHRLETSLADTARPDNPDGPIGKKPDPHAAPTLRRFAMDPLAQPLAQNDTPMSATEVTLASWLERQDQTPLAVLMEMMRDADIRRGLARGQRQRAEASPHPLESLLSRARARVSDALGFLSLETQGALAPVRDASSSKAAARRLVLSFKGRAPLPEDRHCLVFLLEGGRPHLVYPTVPGDPTLTQALEGRRFTLKAPQDDTPQTLALVFLRDMETLRWAVHPETPDSELNAWLQDALEGTLPGVTVHLADWDAQQEPSRGR